ncbi:hypothetical protein Tco_0081786, partial [Tanacetum coccineum]
ALAAEEAHSTSSHSRAETSPRDAQGDEGLLDLYALNREVRRLKKQTLSQAKQIIKLKIKLKKVLKMVQPVVHHHTLWVASQKHKKRRKKQKKQKKKVSSVKLGRNKDEGTLSEEHYVQDDYTAGPSSPIRPTQNIEPEEQFEVDKVLADISRPRGLSIPGPIQSQPQPQQPSQATDSKDKGKGILIQAEWDAEEERKRFEELKKAKPKTTLRKPTSLTQERNRMMNFLKGQGYQNLQKLKYP